MHLRLLLLVPLDFLKKELIEIFHIDVLVQVAEHASFWPSQPALRLHLENLLYCSDGLQADGVARVVHALETLRLGNSREQNASQAVLAFILLPDDLQPREAGAEVQMDQGLALFEQEDTTCDEIPLR